MTEREATKNIAPAELVTDENSKSKFAGSILPPDVEAKCVETALRELTGLDGRETQRVREVLDGEVTTEWWPKWRSTLAMLVRAVAVARAMAQDNHEISERLRDDLGTAHMQLADATAELAISRKEFAAEVQRSQNLQHRLTASTEAALETINDLVSMISAAGLTVRK